MSIMDEGFRAPGGTSRNRPHGNLRVLRWAVLGMFLILAVRLGQMQIVDGAEYATRSAENHVHQKNILPTRGLITDRNGEALVQNIGIYSASILPEALPNADTFENWKEMRYKMYLKLEELTATTALEIQTRVEDAEDADRGYIAIKVADNLTKEQALALDEVAVDMPGVTLEITPGRLYIGGHERSRIELRRSRQRLRFPASKKVLRPRVSRPLRWHKRPDGSGHGKQSRAGAETTSVLAATTDGPGWPTTT